MEKLSCILLIDDDLVTNFTNQLLLEDMNVTNKVLVAHNGKEAINLIKQSCEEDTCPELILLDINMPVMNGFEFLQAYEALGFVSDLSVVIVMLTTSLNPLDVDRLKDAPIRGHLNKPLTENMMRELLQKHFPRNLPA
jgi:CheY-like chemotaxis protein